MRQLSVSPPVQYLENLEAKLDERLAGFSRGPLEAFLNTQEEGPVGVSWRQGLLKHTQLVCPFLASDLVTLTPKQSAN